MKSDNVRVHIRIRPISTKEIDEGKREIESPILTSIFSLFYWLVQFYQVSPYLLLTLDHIHSLGYEIVNFTYSVKNKLGPLMAKML